MALIHSLRTSASALMAQRLRMDVIANNVANMNTTRTDRRRPLSPSGGALQPSRDARSRSATSWATPAVAAATAAGCR